MKNTRKVLGIIALVAVIGFAMIACGGDDGSTVKVLLGVSVTNLPTKKVYAIGDAFDPAGMVVTAAYTDTTTEPVTDYTVNGFDSTSEGIKQITVTHKGLTSLVPFPVTVLPAGISTDAVLASIFVTTQPTKILYNVNEDLDLTGMVVTAVYIDASTAEITDDSYTTDADISYDKNKLGHQMITVTYIDKSAIINVYVIDPAFETVATPVAVPAPGPFIGSTNVTLTTATPDALIYYTLNGTDPTISSTLYITPITISTTTTIKAFAVKVGMNDSAVLTALYEMKAAKPAASPATGTYNTVQNVALSSITEDALIYYTLDGTAPTKESTPYVPNTTIPITATTTLKAIAVKGVLVDSDILTEVYTLQTLIPTASPAAGTYLTPQSVTLSTTTEGASIRYTLDGSDPTATTGALYNPEVPISITSTTTLKARTVKDGWTISPIMTVTYNFSYKPLTADTWADGTAASGTTNDQWFKFTASASTTYIHFQPGTATQAYVQLYGADGTTAVGSQSTFYNTSSISVSRATEADKDYYIKISYAYSSGTYKIAYNNLSVPPSSITIPTTDVGTLTANTWADGNIASSDGEQWFKFTASAASYYIHFYTGTLYSVILQRYDANGRLISGTWNGTTLSGTTLYVNQTSLTSGNDYYIKVTPSGTGSGAYKIGFNTSTTPPTVTVPSSTATTLTVGTWDSTGNIATAGTDQWFKFTTATAGTHYIHIQPGTLTSLYVQLYTADNTASGSTQNITTSNLRASTASLTTGNTFYIRVTTSGTTGTYSIAVNATQAPPAIDNFTSLISSAATLTGWADGNITTDQWFKINPTAGTQSIYFRVGTLNNVYIRLYDSTGVLVGNAMTNLTNSTFSTSRAGLTTSSDYYIRVTPSSSAATGTYKIGIIFPPDNTAMTLNTWADGNIIVATGDQWFKFTATATTQYIHFLPGIKSSGGLNDVYVQLYNSTGATVGSESELYNTSGAARNIFRSLTANDVYYIRVRPYYSSAQTGSLSDYSHIGTFKMAFNTSSTAPTAP